MGCHHEFPHRVTPTLVMPLIYIEYGMLNFDTYRPKQFNYLVISPYLHPKSLTIVNCDLIPRYMKLTTWYQLSNYKFN